MSSVTALSEEFNGGSFGRYVTLPSAGLKAPLPARSDCSHKPIQFSSVVLKLDAGGPLGVLVSDPTTNAIL